MTKSVIGLDIGGANIKAVHSDGPAVSRPFEIWKQPERLTAVLGEVLAEFDPFDLLAVTMTAELADCFETKAEGVHIVLQSVERVAAGKPISVWQTGAEFVEPDVAREIPLLVAAANWHALATWVGRLAPDATSLLLDVGTTTTDIIPLLDGVPVPVGLTDSQRLIAGELAYSGVRRTPVCAVAHTVPFRESYCPLAAEFFATMFDVYLTLGTLPENARDRQTADGREATREKAGARLARMLCCDPTELTHEDIETIARFLADVQHKRLAGSLSKVLSRQPEPCRAAITSGSGEFLARRLIAEHPKTADAEVVSLGEMFGPGFAASAPATAVARLAVERL